MNKLVLAVDFDGTIASENYPDIGTLKRGAKETINSWYDSGHTIIINSCRSGKYEIDMIEFLETNGIKYHEVNNNSPHRIDLYARDCRKIGADIYIDDKNCFDKVVLWKEIKTYVNIFANQKPIIICIVGESGTGKTTIAEYIECEHSIKMIQSYTDRPPRYAGENGHTFVSEKEFDIFKRKDMIAYTEFGSYRYCCFKTDVLSYNTYVIDLDGLKYLQQHYYDIYEIIAINITRHDDLRTISDKRVLRDKNRFEYSDMEFDYYIYNNTEQKESLYNDIDYMLKYLLNW